MAIFALDKELVFPPVHLSEPDGLLAMGGDLSPERLLLAYRHGIFPWYEGEHILWWSPDPRFVLFPGELKVSKSIKPLLKRKWIRADSSFAQTIRMQKRSRRMVTWIVYYGMRFLKG